MSIQDFIKKSILESGAFDGATLVNIALGLITAVLMGGLIYLIYSKFYVGVIYSRAFAITLVGMTVLTAMVTLAISTNIVISLGMVGALSIVRFRAAIKDPLDIAFLFWAIGAGIVLAAGMIPLAIIGSICIGLILLVFVNQKSHTRPYMVVLSCESHDAEVKAKELLAEHVIRMTVKSKSAVKGAIELNIEVRLKEDDTDFVNTLSDLPGVNSAVIVSYNGDYMG